MSLRRRWCLWVGFLVGGITTMIMAAKISDTGWLYFATVLIVLTIGERILPPFWPILRDTWSAIVHVPLPDIDEDCTYHLITYLHWYGAATTTRLRQYVLHQGVADQSVLLQLTLLEHLGVVRRDGLGSDTHLFWEITPEAGKW